MTVINTNSISGISSITTPSGVGNQLTLHTNNTTEAFKLDSAGNLHFHNHLNITGISSASNFKTGTSNLHNTGLNVQDLDVDGHTNLDNVSIAGVTTFASNVSVGNSITATGLIQASSGAASGNKGIKVGGSLTIEDVGNVRFAHTGASSFYYNAVNHELRNIDHQRFIVAGSAVSGGVGLFHYSGGSSTEKLRVTSSGVTVTGKTESDSLDVDGVAGIGSLTVAGVSTFTGNIDANGDLDVDGQTNLDHVSVAGITTFNNNVHLLDNDYIRFGSSQDLSIFHDGTNNWFWSGGGHPTIHESSGSWTLRSVANQNYIIATENNSVDLYYSGTKRFETTSTGANVTGNFGASGNISLSGSFIMPDSLMQFIFLSQCI